MQFAHQPHHHHQPQPHTNQFAPSTHHWERFSGHIPQGAVYASDIYLVIRADNGLGDHVVGKYHIGQRQAYIPYGGLEVATNNNVEVLVAAPGLQVNWVPASHGTIPSGTIGPIGKEGLFVGRAVCPQPENKHTPGKIHPGHKCLYMPWGGKEERFDTYEALVITSGPAHHWEKFTGSFPHGTVYASDTYAVIRADNGHGDFVVGKYHTGQRQAYIPYGGKEVPVSHNVEILVAAPGSHVQWVTGGHGSVVQGAVGPIGNEGLFVGRARCPQPENQYTPGKIHPGHKCLYMPWGGKEERFDTYEVLVIKF